MSNKRFKSETSQKLIHIVFNGELLFKIGVKNEKPV